MGGLAVDLSEASDALRTELIFVDDDGGLERIDGAYVLRTPSNPSYWWGNCIRPDHPPRDGDYARWTGWFARHVHAVQPASDHMTFEWAGAETGEIAPFLAHGFDYFEMIALTAERGQAVVAPHRDASVEVLPVTDWESLRTLLVETRDPPHTEADHRVFVDGRIATWRRLEARGQGRWFCIRDDHRTLAALGVFAEAHRGPDGRRIGRFQHVTTHPSARRRGYAGLLVEHASRHAFAALDVDTLMIVADENDHARRVYEACGYRLHARQRHLERPGSGTA